MRRPALFRAGFLALSLSCALYAPGFAQSVVGKSMVDGRHVSLFDDGTWAFSDTSGSCDSVAAGLEFCGKDAGWKGAKKPSPDYAAAYRLSDRLYGGFIIEGIGTDQGLSTESVRALILDISAGSAGSPPVLLETAATEVSGHAGEMLAYALKIRGLDVVYANSFVLSDARILQVLSYEVGTTTLSDSHRAAHAGFVAATRYTAD